ncbi:MAG: peptidoglycan editing factor PgeF [Clostridia bacterium]|nr:peptidoglycan editing factor PgeF [Clostridia bacterium]
MFITSKILRSPHGFCTREGGISTLEHTKSLNLAFGRGDDDETVLRNLEILAERAGFDPKSVISLPQIHSDTVYKVGKADAGQGYYIRDSIRSGDGYVTDEREVTLGVKAADCVPILFEAERDGEIVAVGAVHAGWRGTVAGIQQRCAEMLCREYGVHPHQIRAAIGPCIGKCCYEVGPDLFAEVENRLGEEYAKAFVTPIEGREGKYFCDLPSLNRALLLDCGLPPQGVDVIGRCTCCEPSLFFSHRYTGGKRGTMLNFILLK